METKYSLTTLLSDMLKLQNNSYQIISSLSDLVSSKSETVEIPILGNDGITNKIIVPSFGSMKSQLQRVERDIKSLSGISDSTASVRLSDGTFRKILVSNLQREAEDIKSMPIPSSFATKENWFFESFLNPLLYISFDLGNQVKYNTENVEVSRYILNIDTDTKRLVFSQYFQKKSDISYSSFSNILINNGIKYFLDKSIIPLPPRTVRYSGKFSITKISDSSTIDTVTNTKKRLLTAKLDKLTYDDSLSSYLGTQTLKIGDSLIINNERKNTRYEIVSVDSGNRSVTLRLVEGYDSLSIGVDILSFYSINESPVKVDVNIGFNEYSVIFIKPIDPDSKISSVNWSPGVGVYTNDLTTMENGEEITLAKYYQDKVIDFGSFIYSLAKEGTIPSSLGVDPDAPILKADEFKVIQINKHSTDKNSISDVRRLHSDRLKLYSDINNIDSSLTDARARLQRTRYTSVQAENTDRTNLQTLIQRKSSLSNLYTSVIDDINSISTSFSLEDTTPKYRVRGFFPMPIAKTSQRTAAQEVVQFVIQYRYLSKDGGSNQPETIEFKDANNVTRRGNFATWSEVKSPVRRRVIDPISGNITWVIESVENGDELNINSIDLPISNGEIIEFRVKSLSEAGWPVSPKESEWSDPIRVEFPSELEGQVKISQIIQEAKEEKVRLQLQKDLNQLGFTKHVINSFDQNGKYFAHPATEVSSGFLTPEQNVISLFDKLNSMDSEISRLRGIIEAVRGVLSVKIIDEIGQEYPVVNNGRVRLFAGNYRDQVQSLQIKKGVIVTKNYFIKLINDSANTLELYSRYWGNSFEKVQNSFSEGSTFLSSDTDYNKLRRYDFVPIGMSNPNSIDVSKYGFIRDLPQQSSQVLSQFIYCRYFSVDGREKFYGDISSNKYQILGTFGPIVNNTAATPATSTLDLEYTVELAQQTSISSLPDGDVSKDFVWKGVDATKVVSIDSIMTNLDVYNKSIGIHISHPEIVKWNTGANTNEKIVNAQRSIRNSILANQSVGSTGALLQTPLFFEGTGSTGDRYSKIGFEANDQYLLGPRSVGAYLFINPSSHKLLTVDGSDSISVKTIKFGNSNSISIPLIFQYRMTDYYGFSKEGTGNLGGRLTPGKNDNLTYTKAIGIDIYSNLVNKERFSFDIEVTARYYSNTITEKDLPAKTFPAAIDDLSNIIIRNDTTTSRDAYNSSIFPNRQSTGDRINNQNF